jgi:hypothetical protein
MAWDPEFGYWVEGLEQQVAEPSNRAATGLYYVNNWLFDSDADMIQSQASMHSEHYPSVAILETIAEEEESLPSDSTLSEWAIPSEAAPSDLVHRYFPFWETSPPSTLRFVPLTIYSFNPTCLPFLISSSFMQLPSHLFLSPLLSYPRSTTVYRLSTFTQAVAC